MGDDNVADDRHIRPRICDLTFGVSHESLTTTAIADRRTTWPGGGFRLSITAGGHVLVWSDRGVTLVEALSATPLANPLLSVPVQGQRRGKLTLDRIHYQVGLQVEVLDADVFAQVHDELAADAARRGLFHRFGPAERIALAPLAWVTVEPVRGGLATAAFHTFPAEFAIVKTQSLIETR